jgi:hypothetical protein
MYTSIVLVALTGSVVASTPVDDLTWHKNYDQARQMGQTDKKPLAVIFGSGQGGCDKVCREGQLSPEVQKTLGESYVCVYVDVNTSAGKKLASAFAITRETGMVLSDRSGNLQAFYHDGDISNADLQKWVTRFADPNVTVRSTMTNDSAQVSMYPPSGGLNGTGALGGYSSGAYGSYGGYSPVYGGGGCPGGNCGGGGGGFRRR